MSIAKVSASVLLSALACSACGTMTSAKKDQAPAATAPTPKISEDQAKSDGAKLPSMVIIKVPVDANGKEMHDKAEMRLVTSNQEVTKDNVSGTFEAAQAPQKTIDELDQSSSTESCGWLGWGLGYRGYYGGGYGGYGWNWGFYRPAYVNYGYNYGYNYGGYYGGVAGGYGNGGYGSGNGNGYGNGGAGNQGYGNGYGGSNNYYYYNNSFNHAGQGGYSGQGTPNTYTNGVY